MARIGFAYVALLAGLTACSSNREPSAWVRDHAVRIDLSNEGTSMADLEAMRSIVGNARIVALGDPTHGTHEAYEAKRRIIEFLVTRMGFSVVAIEGSMPDARPIDDFIQTGKGDPKTALAGLYSWLWYTEEVFDLVHWMRGFTASGKGSLHFTGFDMQHPRSALINMRDFFAKVEPHYVPELEQAMNRVYGTIILASQPERPRAEVTLSAEGLAGKRFRCSGFIRTEQVTNGAARLDIRAQREDGSTLSFAEAKDSEVTGTSPWSRSTVELNVPPESRSVVLGMTLDGDGCAWFDSFEFETEDQVYRVREFNPGFESAAGLQGVNLIYADSRSGLDRESPQSGGASLRLLEDAADKRKRANELLGPSLRVSQEAVKRIEGHRGHLPKGVSSADFEWALQNARLIVQVLEMLLAGDVNEVERLSVAAMHPIIASRDSSMSGNLSWILDHATPGAKVVIWAHNLHVSKRDGWMGQSLAARYANDFVTFGFAFSTGKYRVGLKIHEAIPPPAGSVEEVLQRTGLPSFMLDLRRIPRDSRATRWATEPRPFRAVGPVATEDQFFPTVVGDEYDALVYFDRTTPTVLGPN